MTSAQICELVDLYGDDLYRFCCHLTGNPNNADDLYQDTFMKAVEQHEKIDADQNPKAFLLSIANFLWKSMRRKSARRHLIAPEVPLDETFDCSSPFDLEQLAENDLLIEAIRICTRTLHIKYRTPLYLHYASQMSMAEIAEVLNLPLGTVKTRIRKGKQLIQNGLEGMGHETRVSQPR